jgi:hypothetical protein
MKVKIEDLSNICKTALVKAGIVLDQTHGVVLSSYYLTNEGGDNFWIVAISYRDVDSSTDKTARIKINADTGEVVGFWNEPGVIRVG